MYAQCCVVCQLHEHSFEAKYFVYHRHLLDSSSFVFLLLTYCFRRFFVISFILYFVPDNRHNNSAYSYSTNQHFTVLVGLRRGQWPEKNYVPAIPKIFPSVTFDRLYSVYICAILCNRQRFVCLCVFVFIWRTNRRMYCTR